MERSFKIIVWLGLVALLSIWMWGIGKGETFNSVTGLEFQWLPLVAFLFLVAVTVLGYIMFQQRRWSFATTALVGLTFLSVFGWTKLNSVAILGFLLFNLWSANRVQREIIERKVLNITDALYHGLTPLVLGLFLMFSFAAYQSTWADQVKEANQLPSQAQAFFQQLTDKFIGNQIQTKTPQEHRQVVNSIASQTFQQFNAFLRPYFQYAPPLLAFGLFVILWGLSFVFIWAGIAVGLVLYRILKKTGMVRVEKKHVEAEVLVV